MKIEINKQFKQNYVVSEYNTAKYMGSGDLDVLAFLNSFLTNDLGSVGSNININHLAPTLVNKEITILGEITETIKDKIIIFNLEAFEGEKKIGDASHTRVIINNEKFINKLNQE